MVREVQQLSSLPNLIECRLSATILMFDEVPTQSIVFPRLQRLSIDYVGVLQALDLPKLNSFWFTALYTSDNAKAILQEFLTRYPCTLLCVTTPTVLRSVLMMSHDSLRSVRRLSMTMGRDTVHVLEILRSGALPRLEAITLKLFGSGLPLCAANFNEVFSMIAYRLRDAGNVQKMKSLRLCRCEAGLVEELRCRWVELYGLGGFVIEHNESYGLASDWTQPWWFIEDDLPDGSRGTW